MILNRFKKLYKRSINSKCRILVYDFFIAFSRFECALKNSIRFANVRYNKVEANWELFTSSFDQDFDRSYSNELNDAVSYIIENPPKIQKLQVDRLVWEDNIIDENTVLTTILGRHIRTIRNNLFHGGKFNGEHEPDISRNYLLLNSAMIILEEWLRINSDIKDLFLQRID
jgi:hypothetical protein